MSIGSNIVKYRKAKNYTQEQLGNLLGVTNQAVSKWEAGMSMPDITLLPAICSALGITLNMLYGIDAFDCLCSPMALHEKLSDGLSRKLHLKYLRVAELSNGIEKIRENQSFGWITNTQGIAFGSNSRLLIDTSHKTDIFTDAIFLENLKKFVDKNVQKFLSFYSRDLEFELNGTDLYEIKITITDAAKDCNMTQEEVAQAIDTLIALRLIEKSDNGYNLLRPRLLYAIAVLNAAREMVFSEYGMGCPNENSLRVGFLRW